HRLEVHVALAARGALDGALDVVLGHACSPRLIDGQAQTRVHGGIRATLASRGGDLTRALGEDLAALLVLSALAVLDVRPRARAGHDVLGKFDSKFRRV